MIAFCSRQSNIDPGVLNRRHPFDGRKFAKVHEALDRLGLEQRDVAFPVTKTQLDVFAGEILRELCSSKRYILRALEGPYIPLLPFSFIDKRVLAPMRWAVQGTIAAAEAALDGLDSWNLSGATTMRVAKPQKDSASTTMWASPCSTCAAGVCLGQMSG